MLHDPTPLWTIIIHHESGNPPGYALTNLDVGSDLYYTLLDATVGQTYTDEHGRRYRIVGVRPDGATQELNIVISG